MSPPSLLLVEQIRPRTTQIDDLWTTVPILLEARALEAVESVRYALSSTYDAFILVIPEGTFVADAHERRGAYVRVADGAFAVAFVAQTAEAYACGFAAHGQVWMVARHGEVRVWLGDSFC